MRKSRVSFPREEVAEGKSQFVFAFKLRSGERIEMCGQMSEVFLEAQMCKFIDMLQEEGRKLKNTIPPQRDADNFIPQ